MKLKPALRGVWWGGRGYLIDKISGLLATPETPEETLGEVVVKEPHSILYWLDKKNPLGEAPQNPEDDPQFKLWETPVQKWLLTQKNIPGINEKDVPTTYDDVHLPQFVPTLTITEPSAGRVYSLGEAVRVEIKSAGRYPLVKADFFLNNNFIGSSNQPSFFSFVLDENSALGGFNELKVVGYDSVFNSVQATASFVVGNNP